MGAMLGLRDRILVPPSDLANLGLKTCHDFETGPHDIRSLCVGQILLLPFST